VEQEIILSAERYTLKTAQRKNFTPAQWQRMKLLVGLKASDLEHELEPLISLMISKGAKKGEMRVALFKAARRALHLCSQDTGDNLGIDLLRRSNWAMYMRTRGLVNRETRKAVKSLMKLEPNTRKLLCDGWRLQAA
jgi:hypothetical protein